MAGGEGLLDARPSAFEPREQRRRAAIAHAHPQQPPGVALAICEVEKSFVLGHDDAPFGGGASPDVRIGVVVEREVEDVHGIFAARREPAGERSGKLIIHDELHPPTRTT